jgi:hypothetical protein
MQLKKGERAIKAYLPPKHQKDSDSDILTEVPDEA